MSYDYLRVQPDPLSITIIAIYHYHITIISLSTCDSAFTCVTLHVKPELTCNSNGQWSSNLHAVSTC